ncbi:MAG: phosphoribosylanthranilate isomerase [Dehalococcoidia bacterium]|nr:MAG: phosphoribosylanthranilate isomerase [Dehalococcoidia bacterium]
MTKIKICGLTSEVEANAATEAGADFLGLVFAESQRRVTPERAGRITEVVRKLEQRPILVGIFVNLAAVEVNNITRYCGIDMVQLSGDESWSYCQGIELPIIKVIHIKTGHKANQVLHEIHKGYEVGLGRKPLWLLDTKTGDTFGGTGRVFDWKLALEVSVRYPVIIAGGLTLQNITSLIKEVNPWGVDVSSGVESGGKKDINKIRSFIETVRRAEKEV